MIRFQISSLPFTIYVSALTCDMFTATNNAILLYFMHPFLQNKICGKFEGSLTIVNVAIYYGMSKRNTRPSVLSTLLVSAVHDTQQQHSDTP